MSGFENVSYEAIGERVRLRRRALKLTQERLAEQVDLSTSFIGHIERGEKKASLETVAKLASALDTSLDYLILGVLPACKRNSCPLYADF